MKYLCPRDFRRGEMERKMKQMIGYCGLNCERCDAYLATVRDDWQLREKTAKLWAELNHAPILPEHINCLGCRMDGVKTVFCESMCGIRQCARKKGVATCGECPELEACSIVGTILANDPSARKNLEGRSESAGRYFVCQTVVSPRAAVFFLPHLIKKAVILCFEGYSEYTNAAHKILPFLHERRSGEKTLQTSKKWLAAMLLASETGVEPATFRLGGGPSILLRYWNMIQFYL